MQSALPRDSVPVDLREGLVNFARFASTEISTMDESLLPELAQALPVGMSLYVAHTPKATLQDVIRTASKAQSLGFAACPHIVARRLASRSSLDDALQTLRHNGVHQALFVSGDLDVPLGPYSNTLEVIDSGLLDSSGLTGISFAGHPEGHRHAEEQVLLAALRHKQAFAVRTGIAVRVVTQFGFNPDLIRQWADSLRANSITLPISVGIAGPTPLSKLIRFAMQCGVGASIGSIKNSLGAMANLARMAKGPDEMMLGLVTRRSAYPSTSIVAPHIYAFGGSLATARWLRAVIEGRIELASNGAKFAVRTTWE
jgi:methylenetetrahydrofolate reductase (NADPH)